MIIIGLTGSIGMGKSTTADIFRARGARVFDADATVHALYSGPAATLIGDQFPDAVEDGLVDRKKLADIVVDDKAALKTLESIIHPLVKSKRAEFITAAAKEGAPFVVLDIPLLFETGSDADCDHVIVATAPAPVQRQRVLSRPQMTETKFNELLGRQMSDSEKRARADFLIFTDKGLEHARGQVEEILQQLDLQ